MNRPQSKDPAELKKYALYRKNEEMKDMKKINKAVEEVSSHEEYREPLSIEEVRRIKIQLSWGGDGDGFFVDINKDGNVQGGVYYWEDWGVWEEVPLTLEEAEMVAGFYFLLI